MIRTRIFELYGIVGTRASIGRTPSRDSWETRVRIPRSATILIVLYVYKLGTTGNMKEEGKRIQG